EQKRTHQHFQEQRDDAAGDLIVQLIGKKEDDDNDDKQTSVFRRDGADLYLDKTISMRESILGTHFSVQHLNGAVFWVTTDPQVVLLNGDILLVLGKGMPVWKSDPVSFGNL